jgi:hypothetical protein
MRKSCPVPGYTEVEIEFPDELLVKHQRMYGQAVRAAIEANENVSVDEARFIGCKAICTEWNVPAALDERPLEDWPLGVFRWVVDTVYPHYELAANPPKN